MKGQGNVLERQQHKLRGAIGRTRSRGREQGGRDLADRRAIREALLAVRQELPRSQRAQFFDWLDKLGGSKASGIWETIAEDLTNRLVHAEKLPVESELDWIRFLVRPFMEQLHAFRVMADSLNKHFWEGDGEKCLSIVGDMRKTFGESIWTINAEISLKQQFMGLEAQKEYLESLRSKYKGGLPAYFGYLISGRNEQRATVALFDEGFSERLSETKLEDDLKTYLRYKVLGKFEGTASAVSSILRYEQGQPIVDIYETAIDVLQRLVGKGEAGDWRGAAVDLLADLEPVRDPRVAKLSFALTGELSETPECDLTGASGDAAFEELVHEDFWRAAWSVAKPDGRGAAPTPVESDLKERLEALTRSFVNRDNMYEESLARLLKFSRNFGYLPSAKAVGDFAAFFSMAVPPSPKHLGQVLLNSRRFAAADVLYVDQNALERASELLKVHTHPDAVQLWCGSKASEQSPTIAPLAWYAHTLRLAGDDPLTAKDLLEAIPAESMTQAERTLVTNLRLHIQIEAGEFDEAIALIAREIGATPSVVSVMPAQEAIAGRAWDNLSRVPDKVDLALVLYAYWRQTDDSLHATYLRFAFEEVLYQIGANLPGDIPQELITGDPRYLFFAAYVCIPVLIDTSGLFVSSSELLEERLRILVKLMEIDQGREEEYFSEAASIKASKLIKSGLQIVDGNRVSVDTAALERWANKRYRESYSRYQALRAAGIGTSAKFDDIFAQISQAVDTQGQFFTIPDNEADTLLLEIILALKKQFMTDPQYGLEYFLGKRIRHGTVAGHMRGPAESAHLITERRTLQSPYERNSFWLDALSFRGGEGAALASKAFGKFSEDYDNLIADVRDKYLHVKSEEHPEGILDFTMIAPQFYVIKSVTDVGTDFDGFMSICFNSFWALLRPSLTATKVYLSDDVKARVSDLFSELQLSIQAVTSPDEASRNLSIAIQNISTEVQRELDIVASWFDRVEGREKSHLFTLEEVVDISVRSALKSLTTFEPDVAKDVSGGLKASNAVLVAVSDILFVVLDNVYRRAKVGNRPAVSVRCALDLERKRLTIVTHNPIGANVDCEHLRKRLEVTRSKIAAGDIVQGAAADRGSGLLKIASFVRELAGAYLDFGLEESASFRTEVCLPLLVTKDKFSLALPESEL